MKREVYLAKHRIAKGNYFHPFHRQKDFSSNSITMETDFKNNKKAFITETLF